MPEADQLPDAYSCRLGLTRVNVAENPLVLGLGHLRALECVRLERVADHAGALGPLIERLDELVVDGILHQDPRGGSTYLALIRHDACVAPPHSLLKVCIIEDQQRGLASSFQGDVLHCAACSLHDLLAGSGRAGKGDLVDVNVRGYSRARDLAVAVDDVDHARREAGFFDQIGKIQHAQGRLLRQLEHYGVAARERRSKLPGCHQQRKVPWDDLTAHADWLADGVGQLRRADVDDLAVVLVSVAAIVLVDIDHFGHVDIQGVVVHLAVVPGVDGRESLGMLLG